MAYHTAAGRRPTADVRRSAATSQPDMTGSRSVGSAVGRSDPLAARLDADFEVLIDRAIAAIRAAGARADPVFGAFAELNSIVRAVTYHEGKLLEWGVARLATENPALVLMPPETALPIVPAALELLKRNDWVGLEGLRLRSEVHHATSYIPDLFLVDRDRHLALLFDVKRSLASYAERRLNALRRRMMAAALIAGDWLHIEGRVAGVSRVDVAIIDGSSERRDHKSGVFALDEVGDLIGVPDAGEAMLQLRAKFACRVQAEVRAACLRAIGAIEDGSGSVFAADIEPGDDEHDGDGSGALDEDDDEDDAASIALSRSRTRRSSAMAPNRVEWRPITVGFARGGGP
jgi:hypothetical protein